MRVENREGTYVNFIPDGFELVTPDDNTDLPNPAFGLRIETVADGNTIKFTDFKDNEVQLTLKAFEHGYHPINAKRIWSTGTTGTLKIFALV